MGLQQPPSENMFGKPLRRTRVISRHFEINNVDNMVLKLILYIEMSFPYLLSQNPMKFRYLEPLSLFFPENQLF